MHPLITTAYTAFNSRDIDTALTTMRPDVRWPKAFEGVTGLLQSYSAPQKLSTFKKAFQQNKSIF